MLYSIEKTTMTGYANAIRTKLGTSALMTPAEMINAILSMQVVDDDVLVSTLIGSVGAKTAFFIFAGKNPGVDLNTLTERFFTAAAETDNKVYSSEFYLYNSNPTSAGTKTDDNAGLVCAPSTNTTAGQDDYKDLPLFMCFDCNYTIDADTLEPVILAIKDVAGNFSSSPADSFVGVLQMTGWVRRTTTATTKKVEYRSTRASGFVPLPEGVRASDNSVRPYVIHAKYAAGLNANGKFASISGVQPVNSPTSVTGAKDTSHDGQISEWQQWGTQYCGSSLCDLAFVQLMCELKYGTLALSSVMKGCCKYYVATYTAAASESNVTRVLLTAANAAYFVVGSSVSLGSGYGRNGSAQFDVCPAVRILSKEVVNVGGVDYTALNLDTTTPFTTTGGSTYVIPQPWRTGSTDNVLGNDGSPVSNTNSKNPFKIQGIELMNGLYKVPADTKLQDTAASGGDSGYYTVYTNRRAATITAGSVTADDVSGGTITKPGTEGNKNIAELYWTANDQEAYMLAQQFGASSTTGYQSTNYVSASTASGLIGWYALGRLDSGDIAGRAGVAFAYLGGYSLSRKWWDTGCRACGTAGNRGIYTE